MARATPREQVESACVRRGSSAVVAGCTALLAGEEVPDQLLLDVVGPGAQYVLDGGEGGRGGYWPRTWAARALLYVWEPTATAAVLAATGDEHWRVREMALKVIARHRLDDALELLPALQTDPVPRVREAAARAERRLTEVAG